MTEPSPSLRSIREKYELLVRYTSSKNLIIKAQRLHDLGDEIKAFEALIRSRCHTCDDGEVTERCEALRCPSQRKFTPKEILGESE